MVPRQLAELRKGLLGCPTGGEAKVHVELGLSRDDVSGATTFDERRRHHLPEHVAVDFDVARLALLQLPDERRGLVERVLSLPGSGAVRCATLERERGVNRAHRTELHLIVARLEADGEVDAALLDLAAAVERLTELGLLVVEVPDRVFSETVPDGSVVSLLVVGASALAAGGRGRHGGRLLPS